jgi:hypothetical protein
MSVKKIQIVRLALELNSECHATLAFLQSDSSCRICYFLLKCRVSTSSAIEMRSANIAVRFFCLCVLSDLQCKMSCNVNAALACYEGSAITPTCVTTRP